MLAGNAVNQVHQVTFKHTNKELHVSFVSGRFIIAFTKACEWTLIRVTRMYSNFFRDHLF